MPVIILTAVLAAGFIAIGVISRGLRPKERTRRAAEHGDWDGQYNLAEFYEKGECTAPDMEQARRWYLQAARQGHQLALKRCRELGLSLNE